MKTLLTVAIAVLLTSCIGTPPTRVESLAPQVQTLETSLIALAEGSTYLAKGVQIMGRDLDAAIERNLLLQMRVLQLEKRVEVLERRSQLRFIQARSPLAIDQLVEAVPYGKEQ